MTTENTLHVKNNILALIIFTALSSLYLFTSCVSLPQNSSYTTYSINLDSQKVELAAYPHNGPDVTAKHVSEFAMEENCFIAVNTNPFEINKDKSCTILGIHKINGKEYSPPVQKYGALLFYVNPDNSLRARIIQSQEQSEISSADFAFGGFFVILKDGLEIPFKEIKNNRIAVGIDESGKTITFLAARNSSYNDCAKLLKKLGCSDALQFDGGHSAELYINKKTCPQGFYVRPQAAGFGFKFPEQ